MGTNGFRLWFGQIKRQKFISFLNLMGLAIGMAAFILIALFIRYELSYDRFEKNADRIVRVNVYANLGNGQELSIPATSTGVGPALKRDLGGVEDFLRIWPLQREEPVSYKTVTFMEPYVAWADSSLFNVLSVNLIKGDPKTALTLKQTLVLSETTAKKFFGDEDPIGKEIVLNNKYSYTVTGVYEDIPQPSHLPSFPVICSYISLERNDDLPFVSNNNTFTYLLLKPGADWTTMQPTLDQIVDRHDGEILRSIGGVYKLLLQPIRHIHLYSEKFDFSMLPQGSIVYVYQFAAIGIFILLVAILNFINLSTAVSAGRAKQVGVSKALGATRPQLVRQFLMESIATALVALVLAVLLVELLLPTFANLADRPMSLSFLKDTWLAPALILFALVVGTLAGAYPAFFLSSFRPSMVLRGELRGGAKGSRLRGILVVLQFAVSVTLIISTLVVKSQMDYVRNKRLGYAKDHVMVLSMIDDKLRPHYKAMRSEMEKLPGVAAVTTAYNVPGISTNQSVFHVPGTSDENQVIAWWMMIGDDFIQTMDMQMVEGRPFDATMASDSATGIIINETLAKKLGWTGHAPGEQLQSLRSTQPVSYNDLNVIGVIKDFNFESLHTEIRPMILAVNEADPLYMLLRLRPDHIQSTVAGVEKVWKQFGPQAAFTYQFLDQEYDKQYRVEIRTGELFAYFAVLAIIIACLGLFALATFAAEQRTKEIGVRKVLGATTPTLVRLLVQEFVKLVLIANLIAWPVAYLLMQRWLTDFAYRITIGPKLFILTGVLSLTIALVTVSAQAIRAALTDPVKSLRYE